MLTEYDLIIIGGGSAGIGACLAAATAAPAASILLIERDRLLGGTSTTGGVHNWEPGIVSGFWHAIIADRLSGCRSGCVGKTVQLVSTEQPMAFSDCCGDPYSSTLRRAGLTDLDWRRFQFDPEAMSEAMTALIQDRPNITVLTRTCFTKAVTKGRQITGIQAIKDQQTLQLSSKLYIDASADISLARASGCAYTIGQEAQSAHDEPSAPDAANDRVNAVSLTFRVTAKTQPGIDEIPEPYRKADLAGWLQVNLPHNRPVSFVTQYPDGDYCFNMLPTMEGAEYLSLDPDEAYEQCKARVYHYFQWLQKEKDMAGYRIKSISPRVGVRETWRLLARQILNERDLRAPFGTQAHFDEVIAFADHSIDIHGQSKPQSGLSKALEHPYGIPYRCLLPREIDNLLVACRGAGFSHLAASSCRLSRTMMSLGEAAGLAGAQCITRQLSPSEVDVKTIQEQLAIQQQIERIRQVYD